MAHVIEGLSYDQVLGDRQTRVAYPWDEWFDGKTRVLVRGTDFKVGLDVLQNMLYRSAKKRNVAVKTKKLPSGASIAGVDLPDGGLLVAAEAL